MNTLLEECRVSGYFNINDISMAIMESSGRLSFMPKTQKRSIIVEDMQIKPKSDGLVANVILDGKIMEDSLQCMGKDTKWLMKKLKEKDINDIKEVLLATYDMHDTFEVFLRNNDIAILDILE